MNKKNPAAVALGRRGGKFKGRKGFAAMTPEDQARIRALALEGRKKKAAPAISDSTQT